MRIRVRDADADQKMRPQRLMDLMIYVGWGKDNRAPSSGLLLLGTALRQLHG
jgi:hypothetical protein